ncbi:Crp/Fnr family transcriptional regulator [Parachitinimonas caeni]|uniref:Cyclic nucleotide-binding domain-containing protein n=1 Tax=Parachitinimonas caeni TaxID=3031301 RepID=A0ABT7DYS3_9NEIS|nr:cyclic nucleotide-binding domain-containing protein [Parachitinimonas caeni]MDK2125203.1 cyclic nucleotide-binding domain-containing protein [Parachitinimonas caeni]
MLQDHSLKTMKVDVFDLLRDKAAREKLDIAEALADLDKQEMNYFAGVIKAYQLPAGTVLFREGDPASYMGVVLDGRLTVSKRNDENTGKPVYSMSVGKMFGEMAILDGEPRSATVTAATDSVIAILSRDAFQALCRDRPGIALKIMLRLGRLLSQRLRRATGLLVDYLP